MTPSRPSTETMGSEPALDHVALHVRHLDHSEAFYRTVLGLKRIADPFQDGTHAWFGLGLGRALHLIAGGPTRADDDINVHFALRVHSVPKFRDHLQSQGIDYFSSRRERGVTTRRPDGVLQVYFQDPDGYWIEVNDAPA